MEAWGHGGMEAWGRVILEHWNSGTLEPGIYSSDSCLQSSNSNNFLYL
jgi:hypothetical protein